MNEFSESFKIDLVAAKCMAKPDAVRPYLVANDWDINAAIRVYNHVHGIVHTMNKAGVIRNSDGDLVGHWSRNSGELFVVMPGIAPDRTYFKVMDEAHAMDLINECRPRQTTDAVFIGKDFEGFAVYINVDLG